MAKCQTDVSSTNTEYRRSVVGVAICGPLAVSLTTFIHWKFAYKYCELSYRVQSVFKREKSPDLSKIVKLNKIVLFNIFFWPFISVLMFPTAKLVTGSKLMMPLYYIGLWT